MIELVDVHSNDDIIFVSGLTNLTCHPKQELLFLIHCCPVEIQLRWINQGLFHIQNFDLLGHNVDLAHFMDPQANVPVDHDDFGVCSDDG